MNTKLLLCFLSFLLAVNLSSHSSSLQPIDDNNSGEWVLHFFSPKVIYENTYPEQRERLEKLPEDLRNKDLRKLAIGMAIFDYLESAEDGFVSLRIPREAALKAGLTEDEYDQVMKELYYVNTPYSHPQGKVTRGVSPEKMKELKDEVREYRKLFEGKE